MSKAKVELALATPQTYVFKVTRGQVEVKRPHQKKYRPTIADAGDHFVITRNDFWNGKSHFIAA